MNEQGLLQEIEEDLARKRAEALWKKYGLMVLGAAAAVVLTTAGVMAWKSYQAMSTARATTSLLEMVMEQEAAAPKLDDVLGYAEDHDGVYGVLAHLKAASLAQKEGDKEKALEIYNSVSADTKVEPFFRQLADLLVVQTNLDTAPAEELEARLSPLMAAKSPWRFSAYEYAGYLAVRTGDKEKARKLFAELSAMPDLPADYAQRTTDVMRWLSEE